MADQVSATIRLIAAIPRIIPTIEEMPILPVAFRNQTSDMIPSRIAVMAKMPVRMTHERMPKIRLKKPSQFLLRFGAAFGTAAGAGTAAGDDCITGTTGAGAGAAAGEDTGAGCARDAACLFPRASRNCCRTGWYRDSGSHTHRRTYSPSADLQQVPLSQTVSIVAQRVPRCQRPCCTVWLFISCSPRRPGRSQAVQDRSAGSSRRQTSG